jgi:hypothetical protein
MYVKLTPHPPHPHPHPHPHIGIACIVPLLGTLLSRTLLALERFHTRLVIFPICPSCMYIAKCDIRLLPRDCRAQYLPHHYHCTAALMCNSDLGNNALSGTLPESFGFIQKPVYLYVSNLTSSSSTVHHRLTHSHQRAGVSTTIAWEAQFQLRLRTIPIGTICMSAPTPRLLLLLGLLLLD